MKPWFYKMSLQKKMLLSFAVLFIISLAALLFIFVRNFRQEREAEVSHMNQYNGQLSLNLDTMISGLEPFRHMHFSDDEIRNLLISDDSDIDEEKHKEMEEKLTEDMTLLTIMGDYVLRTMLVTEDGRVYKSVSGNDTAYLEKVEETTGDIVWEKGDLPYFSQVHDEYIGLGGYEVITMVSPVWNVVGEKPLAMVYLDLDFNKISNQWYRSASVGEASDFMVLSPSQILFDSGDSGAAATDLSPGLREEVNRILKEGEGEGILKLHGQACVVTLEENGSTGWYLVQYTPTAVLNSRIIGNMSVVLMILGGVIVATAAGSYILARQVSRPVRVLSQVMGRVARDSREEQEIPVFEGQEILWEDEVGQMIQSYNSMASRINDNIIKMYIYRLNQKQTELKMLQFQINPHFLYNALNTISAIARLEEVELIPEIASGLSDMFRYNISGSDIVTMREELEQTRNYLNIQKIRFPNRFQVYYEVEEELMDCRILKFVLQPIVENAYKYGFSRKRQRDVLWIRGRRTEEEDIVLEVEDDGIGIEPEKVEILNEKFKKSEFLQTSGGIGLQNVNARLKNYYGDGYGLSIQSEPGHYTRVSLKIKNSSVQQQNRGTENDSSSSG